MAENNPKPEVKWPALESNPDCFNRLLQDLGVPSLVVKDVFAFEKDIYWGKHPYAVLLCFSNYEQAREILDEHYADLAAHGVTAPPEVFMAKQHIENASGTFALFNALSNLDGRIDLGQGIFSDWLAKAKAVDEDQRSDLILGNLTIERAHKAAAGHGVSQVEAIVNNHFITFLQKEGVIYEIDSRGIMPRSIGKTNEEAFLVDCGDVIQDFMKKLNSTTFSALALLPKDD